MCVRGNKFLEYYKQPEATREAVDSEGWYHSGDIGYFDDNGYVIFTGRLNDSYKILGELVSPHFLEKQIMTQPYAKQVSIVGIPDSRCQSVGVAFVDLADDLPETKENLINYCQTAFASFQVPKYFVWMPEQDWPKTGSGKNSKPLQRELAVQLISEKSKILTVVDIH